jgi:hypothetical protein
MVSAWKALEVKSSYEYLMDGYSGSDCVFYFLATETTANHVQVHVELLPGGAGFLDLFGFESEAPEDHSTGIDWEQHRPIRLRGLMEYGGAKVGFDSTPGGYYFVVADGFQGAAANFRVWMTCFELCGNGLCDESENCLSCPGDCQPVCGDGHCEDGEHCAESADSCPEDCVQQ